MEAAATQLEILVHPGAHTVQASEDVRTAHTGVDHPVGASVIAVGKE
jgi:hypothetical protein